MKVVSFKADEDLLKILDEYARKSRMSRSEVIRRAIRLYLLKKQEEKKPFVTKRVRIY